MVQLKISIMNHLELIRENFIAKAAYFARLIPGMSAFETAQYARIDCGLPSDTFNVSVLRETSLGIIPALLEPTVGYFSDKKFPMALWVFEPPNYKQIAQELAAHNLPESEINIAMYADLQQLTSDIAEIPGFKIKLVTAPRELRSFADVLAELFEPFDEARQVRKYYEMIEPFYKGFDSQLQFYIGAHNQEVVSTGALFFKVNSVGIFDIATRTDQRGQGFGTSMFHWLVQAAKRQGAKQAVLQASPDGLGIYKRAGFREAGTVGVFENRHLL